MKNLVFLFVSLLSIGALAQSKTIKGKVYLDNTPLKDVAITVVDKQLGVVSLENGSYKIQASEGDVIRYSFIGLKTVEILVVDVTDILNVTMYAKISELDGVMVTDRKKVTKVETQEDFDINKKHILTGFGMKDMSRYTGSVRFIQADEISPGATCILDIMRTSGQAGITVGGNCTTGGSVFSRGGALIYEVDGAVYRDTPIWLNASNFSRIAVMSGGPAALLYRAPGVIVINTKHGGMLFAKSTTKDNQDPARLTDNRYYNDAVGTENVDANVSMYLEALQKSSSLAEAKAAYVKNQKAISGSYFFVLDAFEYFLNTQNDIEFAKKVVLDNDLVLQSNPVALKSLAYIYDAAGQNEEANEVYKEIFMLRPQYAQSYVDMARSYRAMGEYQRAAAMLVRNDYLVAEGFLKTDEHFSKVTDREINNLLQLKGKHLVSGKSNKKYVLDDGFVGTRLVFEWADSEAEFDLQFVNPENRYGTWEHTLNANQERIQQEKLIGYNVEEYLIDDALKGIWKVNINYNGNKKLTPTYLKTTVYYNYGTKAQSKEIKVFKLQLKGINQNLLRIQNGSLVAAN